MPSIEEIKQAIHDDKTIDISTVGRVSGEQRRIEIWRHIINGETYLSGLPGTRDWYANLKENPQFTYHLKESMQVDIPCTAHPIEDEAQRRELFTAYLTGEWADNLEEWIERSPLAKIEFHFDQIEG